jgi:hypothetical protein
MAVHPWYRLRGGGHVEVEKGRAEGKEFKINKYSIYRYENRLSSCLRGSVSST